MSSFGHYQSRRRTELGELNWSKFRTQIGREIAQPLIKEFNRQLL